MNRKRMRSCALAATVILGSMGVWLANAQPGPPPPRFGSPLPGLTDAELRRFDAGREDFLEVEEEKDGLGPFFNGTSCGACHSQPATGGGSHVTVLRAGRGDGPGGPGGPGGPFIAPSLTSVIHSFANPGTRCQPSVPVNANVTARRLSIPLFGDGLIEAIPDATILALEEAGRRHEDGTRGRAARIIDAASKQPRVGKFGWKSQHATLLAFSADAYRTEMGITSDVFPGETGAGFTLEQLAGCDQVTDPEDKADPATGRRAIDRFEDFIRMLAPLPREPGNEQVRAGEGVFTRIGCAVCHVPVLQTGGNANPVFNQKPVPLYSDLLLHDIGGSDGIAEADARPNEIRTTPLWGLRFRKLQWHDGRSLSTEDAVRRHDRESRRSRDRFQNLSREDRQALLAFLDSL
ncbi:MAG: hypothetical protein EXQ52_11630 [Bryobacterales bacterium]|nr:hypothetical protein [Bryobacterales bacterium]